MPAFVWDDALLGSDFAAPNRLRFLRDSLEDLDGTLSARGAGLVIRRGHVVREAVALARDARAEAIFTSDDVSAYAMSRAARLRDAATGGTHRSPHVPRDHDRAARRPDAGGAATTFASSLPSGGAGAWSRCATCNRAPRVAVACRPESGANACHASASSRAPRRRPDLPRGGEEAGRARLAKWIRVGLERYGERHDNLAADATSRLSPYLRFGCVSPREVLARADGSGRAPSRSCDSSAGATSTTR